MAVIFSYLGCFVISYTPLIDKINIYLQDYEILMHCFKVFIACLISHLINSLYLAVYKDAADLLQVYFLYRQKQTYVRDRG